MAGCSVLKNRLIYVFVVVVLLLLVFIYEHEATYTALYAILLLPLVSLISALILRTRYIVKEEFSTQEVMKGDTLQYVFTLTNDSFLLCANAHVSFEADREATDTDIADRNLVLLPYKSNKLTFNVRAKYRGTYRVGVKEITIYDFLGIFKFTQKRDVKLKFTVNPLVVAISELPILRAVQDAAETHNSRFEENYSVVSDFRKYQPTDSWKKIHWKLSANKGELISKNFHATQKAVVTMCIDNSNIKGSRGNALILEDTMIECLVSVAQYCSIRGFPVKLHYMGSETSDVETDNFSYLYAIAAGIKFEEYEGFGDYLADFAKMQTDAVSVYLFLQHITDDIIESVKALRLFGSSVVVFIFTEDSPMQRYGVQQLSEVGVQCIHFDSLLEKEEFEYGMDSPSKVCHGKL